jgi:hypothetical protein
MEYLFKGGSGLYPYPDRVEKWNTSSKEAQVCTLILIGLKMKYLFE